jgi:transcriptional regulator with XRE-family HTH domain
MPNITDSLAGNKSKRPGSLDGSLDVGEQANQSEDDFETKISRFYFAFNAKTPGDLAKILGITTDAVYSARKNRQVPYKWYAIAFYLGVSVDWLFSGKGFVFVEDKERKENQSKISAFPERLKSLIVECSKGELVDFSRITGIPVSLLTSFIDGENNPNREHLDAISDACGVTLEWLVSGTAARHATDVERRMTSRAEYSTAGSDSAKIIGEKINDKILYHAIEMFEAWLLEKNKKYDPDKKAQLIVMLYKKGIENADKGYEKAIEEMMSVLKFAMLV